MSDDGELSPRQELHGISVALRAYVEWHDLCGTTGFPREPRAARPAVAEPPPVEAGAPPPPAPPAPEPVAAAVALSQEGLERALAAEPARANSATSSAAPTPCPACGRGELRQDTVERHGNADAALWFVLDADAGRDGARELVSKMIAAMKLDVERDVHQLVLPQPPAKEHTCPSPLERTIGAHQPRVLVAFGAAALAALIGQHAGFAKLRGQWKLYRGAIPLMPTHALAALLEPGRALQSNKREAWTDLQAVLKELQSA